MPSAEFEERLKAFRLELGLTGDEMAQRIGVKPSTYRNWESGRAMPKPAVMAVLRTLADKWTLIGYAIGVEERDSAGLRP